MVAADAVCLRAAAAVSLATRDPDPRWRHGDDGPLATVVATGPRGEGAQREGAQRKGAQNEKAHNEKAREEKTRAEKARNEKARDQEQPGETRT